nr:hypothetical protein [Tanacetum cinerariifolium]
VILEKIIIDLEDKVVNLLEKEEVNMETIESLKSKIFESSEKVCSESENQSENDCLVIEEECDKEENPKRRRRKSSKQNIKQVDNDVSHANNDFVYFSDLDTFSSVRRPRHRDVIWKKKWSSNTSNVDEVVNLLEKEKVNLETIESLKSKSFELSENVSSESENQSENDCLVVENECDKEEDSKVIAPGIFKLNVSQCVSPLLMSKSSCDSNNIEIKLKRKKRKRKSSKQNVKQADSDGSRANNDFVHFSYLDTFSSVRRPKNSGVIWKKKGSSNTSNVGLSTVSVSNLNKKC